MSKLDRVRTSKYSLDIQCMTLDQMPHKSTKKAKVKERQLGKKIIRKELENKKENKRDWNYFTEFRRAFLKPV